MPVRMVIRAELPCNRFSRHSFRLKRRRHFADANPLRISRFLAKKDKIRPGHNTLRTDCFAVKNELIRKQTENPAYLVEAGEPVPRCSR